MMKGDFKLSDLSVSKKITWLAALVFVGLAIIVLVFSANQVVDSRNKITETVTRNRSLGAMEKIDRNFYERFGDVQAFAYNRLALQMADSGKATVDGQRFINTMVSYYVLYDLMIVLDKAGKVVAANTTDKNGAPVDTEFLIGQDFSEEAWFNLCMPADGPEGGAWYSDFIINPNVAKIYNSKGQGMAFAAPIKNDQGAVIGVWYNFANWKDVTQGIRIETELQLKQASPNAFVIVTNQHGTVIDASDEKLIGNLRMEEDSFTKGTSFRFEGRTISSDNYIIGAGKSAGAYTYKGKGWIALTFYPRVKFSLSILFVELLPFTLTILGILACCIITFLFLSRNISFKIVGLQSIVNTLGRGEFAEIKKNNSKDEIGRMTDSIKSLINGLKKTSGFANEIGKGNLTADFEPLSENDILGHSLLAMRNNLLKVTEENERRNWATQGLAKFGEILRSQDDFKKLGDSIITNLVRYLNANQGSIFVINDDDQHESLELLSCYAWERKKILTMKIEKGDGLVGQCWRDGEMVYITDVPKQFINITSGLGQATPTSIFIAPLKVNEKIFGVIEMASFKKYQQHERDFVEKVCEIIGATISAARITDRTKRLLEQTQQQTEDMRAQEEEMRQNMEELTATQEEMGRKEKDYVARINELEALIDVSPTPSNHSKSAAGHSIATRVNLSYS